MDGSRFEEFKPLYGPTLVCGWASIHGFPVGIIGNNGVLFSDSSQKAAQFIQLCNQIDVPLLFLQNITGYIVGKDFEEGGIIKHGSQMINAVSNSKVPHITVILGASYGAGNYGMSGRAYDTRFVFVWPTAKIAVMGPKQMAGVMSIVRRGAAERAGRGVRRRAGRAHPGRRRSGGRGAIARSVCDRARCGRRDDRPARHAPRRRHGAVGVPQQRDQGRTRVRRLPDVIDWDAIGAFMRAARDAGAKIEPPPELGSIPVDAAQAMAYRATVQHLGSRLDGGSHVAAAYGGLQDSAPRAALYGLHARMHDVGPDDWEHPSLVQIWFRLGADYVIPREALDVFTVGSQPTDAVQRAALNALGDAVRDVVAEAPMRTRDVVERLGVRLPSPHLIRMSQVSGKIVIRWDARTTEIIASDDPRVDPDGARVELARRLVHWYGPVGPMHLARWAAVPKAVALETWNVLRAELTPVDLEGRGRYILTSDVEALAGARSVEGVRLLPGLGDPYLYFDHGAAPSTPAVGPDVSQRLVNSLACRILLDGEVVGSWGRVQEKVTLFPWRRLTSNDIARISAEASSFRGPLGGKSVKIRWLS